MTDSFVKLALITKPHGIHGGMILDLRGGLGGGLLKTKKVFLQNKKTSEFVEHAVVQIKAYKKGMWLQLADIHTPEEVELLRGSWVCLERKKMPGLKKGEFYLSDVVGFAIVDHVHGEVGKLVEYRESPSAPLMVVSPVQSEKEPLWIPMVSDWIEKVDFEAQQIVMNLPEGLLEVI